MSDETRAVVNTQQLTIEETSQAAAELQAFRALETKSTRKKRSKRTRTIVIIVIVIAVLGAAVWGITALVTPPPTQEVMTTEPVARDTFTNNVSGSGVLKPFESVTITPEVDGTIAELKVAEGDMVTAGQVLFTIDNPELDRQVANAQRGVDSANLGVKSAVSARDNAQRTASNAYAAYAQTVATVNAARAAAAQQQALPSAEGETAPHFDEVAAQQQIDTAWQQYEQADMQIAPAQQQIDAAYQQVADAKATLDTATATAAKRQVLAPLSGQVVVQNLERGTKLSTVATAGKPAMQIADLSKMTVTLNVNEIDILTLVVGQEATVSFNAVPDYQATATIKRISSTTSAVGEQAGVAGGVVTYPVDLIIENPDPRLKIGLSASADIKIQELPNVLLVNTMALQNTFDNTATVFVQEADGTLREVEVHILASNDNYTAVEGALQEGDLVVISGAGGSGALTMSVGGGVTSSAAPVTRVG